MNHVSKLQITQSVIDTASPEVYERVRPTLKSQANRNKQLRDQSISKENVRLVTKMSLIMEVRGYLI